MNFLKYVTILCCSQCYCSECEDRIYSHEQLFHFVIETGFRAHASRIINDTQSKTFLKNKQYNETVYKVIAKAIADCRFGKVCKDQNIVIFKGTNPEYYTYSNWNAVILYNLISSVIGKVYKNIR